MQSMPLLLRQSLRSSPGLLRPSCRRLRPAFGSSSPKQLSHYYPLQNPARSFSICLRCQFRTQSRLFSTKEEGKSELSSGNKPSDSVGPVLTDVAANETEQRSQTVPQNPPGEVGRAGDDGLPSEEEGRRSQLSKKFTDMMDNIQSNIFTAGQRINDLTGYSAIEKLKQDIALQGTILPY